jgi:hypothetical protein
VRERFPHGVAFLAAIALLTLAAASSAETVQDGKIRVHFDGSLTPQKLPRHGTAAVSVTVAGKIATTDGSEPPQLRRIQIAINRHGRIDYRGLPACRLEQIQPSTTQEALRACGDAKVGEGRFFANVAIPGQAPFPARGNLIAFNGIENGKPVIFAHVYGDDPVPTSYTVPFFVGRTGGTFATTFTGSLPHVTGRAGFITGIELTLHRNFTYRGHRHSYVTAGCPLPKGISVAPFQLARTTFSFPGKRVGSTLTRACRAEG